MEDTLRELNSDGETSVNNGVLILVLMEDTLRAAYITGGTPIAES